MRQNSFRFRKVWMLMILAVLTGSFMFESKLPTASADGCADTYSMCVQTCNQSPPLSDPQLLQCLYSCEQNSAFGGCFSDGNQQKCDTLFNACRTMGGLGGASEEANCFADYANCQGAVAEQARAGYAMLHGMPLEPDDPCLVVARDEYWACRDGGNSWCISQVIYTSIDACCEGERQKAFAACYGNFGP